MKVCLTSCPRRRRGSIWQQINLLLLEEAQQYQIQTNVVKRHILYILYIVVESGPVNHNFFKPRATSNNLLCSMWLCCTLLNIVILYCYTVFMIFHDALGSCAVLIHGFHTSAAPTGSARPAVQAPLKGSKWRKKKCEQHAANEKSCKKWTYN